MLSIFERLPTELLTQIIGYLTPSEFFDIRKTSTYFAHFTRIHAHDLVPKLMAHHHPILRSILENDASTQQQLTAKPIPIPDRVLKLAIAAMMTPERDLYPGCLLPVLALDRDGTPRQTSYFFQTHEINLLRLTTRPHEDKWNDEAEKAGWARRYRAVAVPGRGDEKLVGVPIFSYLPLAQGGRRYRSDRSVRHIHRPSRGRRDERPDPARDSLHVAPPSGNL